MDVEKTLEDMLKSDGILVGNKNFLQCEPKPFDIPIGLVDKENKKAYIPTAGYLKELATRPVLRKNKWIKRTKVVEYTAATNKRELLINHLQKEGYEIFYITKHKEI